MKKKAVVEAEKLQENGQNTCDKCGAVHKSEELLWITADDFAPKEGEFVPKEIYKKYDALCGGCYLDSIEFRCPECNKKIDYVRIYSECWQRGEIKGSQIVDYSSVEEITETVGIECPECGYEITEFIDQ